MSGTKKNITVLPPLTKKNISELMKERIEAAKTEKTVVPMLWQGLLRMDIPVSTGTRTALAYVPKDIPQGAAFVFLNIPDGEGSVEFLENSGWIDLADREQFCVFAAEPADRHWREPAAEAEYLKECYMAEQNGQYLLPQFSVHAVGYGPIGAEIHKLVMGDPLFAASAAFLDASCLDEAFMDRQRERTVHYGKETFEVPARKIPVPVWINSETMDEQTQNAAQYWIDAARAGKEGEDPVYGTCYQQTEDLSYTPEGHILQVMLGSRKLKYCDFRTTESIYRFLIRYFRYGRGSKSNMISRKVNYQAMDVRFHRFTDANGLAREYLVYVPVSCRGKKDLPLVLVLHGASQSMRNMFENSLWYHKADEEEFIVAMAETEYGAVPLELSGNLLVAHRPLWHDILSTDKDTDIYYIGELVDRLADEYQVDKKRIYLSGHSMGCMTPIYLGTTAIANRFAAIAGTSGIAIKANWTEPAHKRGVPIFLTMGEFDIWDYAIDTPSKVTEAIDTYLIDNGLATEETVSNIRIYGASQSSHGIWNDYTWSDAGGVPRVKYSWIEGWGHVNFIHQNCRFWDEWFSKWTLDERGERVYKA